MEKHWPRSSVLPNYRNKADAQQVDEFVEKIVKHQSMLFSECGLQRGSAGNSPKENKGAATTAERHAPDSGGSLIHRQCI